MLRSAIVIGALLVAVRGVAAAGDVVHDYETVKLADGIYAFISPEPKHVLCSGNSTVIIGDDGVLVVDSSAFPSLARKMIAEIRRLTDKPVRFVVNTHWHQDHLVGNAAYRAAFPQVTIVSHRETRRIALKNNAELIEGQRDQAPALLASLQKALAAGKHSDGRALTEAERRLYAGMVEDLALAMPEWQELKLQPATVTFDHELVVHLGKREVRLLHLGRGNTAGDVVAYVPDARLVASGDLLVGPTPFGYGSYPREWIATLAQLMALDATTIVPGHGPVLHDWTYAKRVVALLTIVQNSAAEATKLGIAREQAIARIVAALAPQKRLFAGDDRRRQQAFDDYFVSPTIDRALQEANGKLVDE